MEFTIKIFIFLLNELDKSVESVVVKFLIAHKIAKGVEVYASLNIWA